MNKCKSRHHTMSAEPLPEAPALLAAANGLGRCCGCGCCMPERAAADAPFEAGRAAGRAGLAGRGSSNLKDRLPNSARPAAAAAAAAAGGTATAAAAAAPADTEAPLPDGASPLLICFVASNREKSTPILPDRLHAQREQAGKHSGRLARGCCKQATCCLLAAAGACVPSMAQPCPSLP